MYKAPYVLPWLDSSDDDPEAGIPFEAGNSGEGNCHKLMLCHLCAVLRCTSRQSAAGWQAALSGAVTMTANVFKHALLRVSWHALHPQPGAGLDLGPSLTARLQHCSGAASHDNKAWC